jgi:ribonuclease HI
MGYTRRQGRASASGNLFSRTSASRPAQYWIAHIDGGARGNPGPAGYGVVVENQDRQRVANLKEYLGIQTNNYAEYRGLLAALNFTLQHEPRALQVISDSELMVRQIKGIYKVKSPSLFELYQQAKALIGKLEWFDIGHVLRGDNRDADRLANEAMDAGMGRGNKGQ